MGNVRWYKRDPRAALVGMSKLTLEECGAYNKILDLIYIHDGELDDDDRHICGWLGCHVRTWHRIRARLINLEKLYLHGGKLRNERADSEVAAAQRRIADAANAGLLSSRKRASELLILKGLRPTVVQLPTTTKKESKKEEGSLARLPDGALRSLRNIEASDGLKRLVAIQEARGK